MDNNIRKLVILSKEDINYTLELWHALEPLCRKWTHTFKDYNEEYDNIFQESYSILTEAVENYQLDSPVYFERYFKTYLYNWRATYLHKKQREVLAKDEKEEESFKNQIENKENTEEQALLNVHLESQGSAFRCKNQRNHDSSTCYQCYW